MMEYSCCYSSVGIVTGYGLDDRGCIPWGSWEFISSPPHPDRLWGSRWVPSALSLGVKEPGREADHSHSSNAQVKECVELYLTFPHTSSWSGV
jgi:hypothetical protein